MRPIGKAVVAEDQRWLTMVNMEHSNKSERTALFALVNFFSCSDKNLCSPPTSRGALALSFCRVLEAAVICVGFVPFFGAGLDSDGDNVIDRVSAFQIKSFLSVYLSMAAFACLLAATAAEKIIASKKMRASDVKQRLHVVRDAHTEDITSEAPQPQPLLDQTPPAPPAAALTVLQRLQRWTPRALNCLNTAFLVPLFALLLLIGAFSGEILFTVYIKGEEGTRRCRSIVLLTLVAICIVCLVCTRLFRPDAPAKIRIFYSSTMSTPAKEQGVVFGLMAFFFVGAWLLGLGDGVELVNDLQGNPFKMLTSRCHPAEEWRSTLLGD